LLESASADIWSAAVKDQAESLRWLHHVDWTPCRHHATLGSLDMQDSNRYLGSRYEVLSVIAIPLVIRDEHHISSALANRVVLRVVTSQEWGVSRDLGVSGVTFG